MREAFGTLPCGPELPQFHPGAAFSVRVFRRAKHGNLVQVPTRPLPQGGPFGLGALARSPNAPRCHRIVTNRFTTIG